MNYTPIYSNVVVLPDGGTLHFTRGTPDWKVAQACVREYLDPEDVFRQLDSMGFFHEDEGATGVP